MPELDLNTYEHHFGRVKRYYERFRALHEGVSPPPTSRGAAMFDDVLSFFVHCHHLRDWVIKDPRSGWSESEVMTFVQQNNVLAIVADICNGAKHLIRDKSPESGAQPNIRNQNLVVELPADLRGGKAEARVRIEVFVEHGEHILNAFDVATEAVQVWQAFLANPGKGEPARTASRLPRFHDVQLTQFALTGQQLKSIPTDEAVLLIHSAHISNTIGILHKLLIFSTKNNPNPALLSADITVHTLIARILAGKVFEGWLAFSAAFSRARDYEPEIGERAKEAQTDLRRYFGRKNLIHGVRNKFSFHNDLQEITTELGSLGDDEVYEFFWGPNGNNLNFAAEQVVAMAMFHKVARDVEADDIDKAHQQFYDEVLHMSGHLDTLAQGCIAAIMRRRFAAPPPPPTSIFVKHVPSVDEARLHFFVGPRAKARVVRKGEN